MIAYTICSYWINILWKEKGSCSPSRLLRLYGMLQSIWIPCGKIHASSSYVLDVKSEDVAANHVCIKHSFLGTMETGELIRQLGREGNYQRCPWNVHCWGVKMHEAGVKVGQLVKHRDALEKDKVMWGTWSSHHQWRWAWLHQPGWGVRSVG